MASLIGVEVTVARNLYGEIPLEERDSHHGCTHFRLREGNTGTVEAIDVLRGEDVVRLRLTSGVVCIVKVDDLDDLSVEERDAIRHFTSSVVHKADNDGGGVDEESSTSEEDSDDDDKGEDPDFDGEDEEPPSLNRTVANGGGSGKRTRCPKGGLYPCEMPPAMRAAHERAMAEKKAKKEAEGAGELEAAAADFERTLAKKAWSLTKKAKYVAIVGEVKSWADRGGTKATAAKWIRRLMSEGTDRLTPSVVRANYQGVPPGAA